MVQDEGRERSSCEGAVMLWDDKNASAYLAQTERPQTWCRTPARPIRRLQASFGAYGDRFNTEKHSLLHRIWNSTCNAYIRSVLPGLASERRTRAPWDALMPVWGQGRLDISVTFKQRWTMQCDPIIALFFPTGSIMKLMHIRQFHMLAQQQRADHLINCSYLHNTDADDPALEQRSFELLPPCTQQREEWRWVEPFILSSPFNSILKGPKAQKIHGLCPLHARSRCSL